jgi:DNA-binding response OmpR family regulator
MKENQRLKVFIQEDEEEARIRITEELKDKNYKIYFFPKSESVFDLIKLNPDILIQDSMPLS